MKQKYLKSQNHFYKQNCKKDILYNKNQIKNDINKLAKQYTLALQDQSQKIFNKSEMKQNVKFDYLAFEYVYPNQQLFKQCQIKSSFFNKDCLENMLLLLDCIKQNLDKNQKQRQIYYKNVENFKNQNQMNKLLQVIYFQLKIPKYYLKIYPSAKGLIYGNINLCIGKSIINCGIDIYRESGCSLSFNDFQLQDNNSKFVLIVEKETVFFELLQQELVQKQQNLILVTARGFGDFLTKRFLKNLFYQKPDLIYLYLGDYDVYGFEILLDYMFGSVLTVHENFNLPFIYPLGLFYEDVQYFQKGFVDLELKEFKKIQKILGMKYFQINYHPDLAEYQQIQIYKLYMIQKSLKQMWKSGKKYEIEALQQNGVNETNFLINKIKLL